jgi:hypothetical protein
MRCRRQLKKHGEGIVCDTCHGSNTFIECKDGCGKVIHVGCFTLDASIINERSVWSCPSCCIKRAITTTEELIEQLDAAKTTETDHCADGAETSKEDVTIFEDHAEMCGEFNLLGFKRYHIQRNTKKEPVSYSWKCKCVLHSRLYNFFHNCNDFIQVQQVQLSDSLQTC